MLITVEQRVLATPARMSDRAREVAAMFGLAKGAREGQGGDGMRDETASSEMTIVPRVEIDVPVPGPGVTLITGPSGSGKSTLLRLIAAACRKHGVRVLGLGTTAAVTGQPAEDELRHVSTKACHSAPASDDTAGDRAVIDLVASDRPLSEALELLSLAGLGDAFVMLRRLCELSDGQRFRLGVAQLMAEAAALTSAYAAVRDAAVAQGSATGVAVVPDASSPRATLIVIDEFAATLDRITARNLARNIRRWSDRRGVAFVLATTHDDLTETLAPELLIRKELGDGLAVSKTPILSQSATRTDSRRRNRTHHPGEPEIPQQRDDAEDRKEHRQRGQRPAKVESSAATLVDLCEGHRTLAAAVVAPGSVRGIECIAAHGPISVTPESKSSGVDEFVIEPGSLADYRALAAFHYRSHHPGAATSVLRLTMRGRERLLAGVLVRSLPHLNCAAREFALRDRYRSLTPHERGIAVNREIRCISRVIIDPRFRGQGLAVRLVRCALDHPEHDSIPYTEALAAMGRVSPFFERAGMRRFDLPEACRPVYARWHDALASAGLTAHDLMRDDGSLAVDGVVAEARRFLRATRRVSRQHIKSMSDRDLLAAAGARLLMQPVYYLFAHQARRH